MTYWNYRLCKYKDPHTNTGYVYIIKEVYYDDDGTVRAWTEDGIDAVGDSKDEITNDLKDMLKAIEERPVLDFTEDEDNPVDEPPSSKG